MRLAAMVSVLLCLQACEKEPAESPYAGDRFGPTARHEATEASEDPLDWHDGHAWDCTDWTDWRTWFASDFDYSAAGGYNHCQIGEARTCTRFASEDPDRCVFEIRLTDSGEAVEDTCLYGVDFRDCMEAYFTDGECIATDLGNLRVEWNGFHMSPTDADCKLKWHDDSAGHEYLAVRCRSACDQIDTVSPSNLPNDGLYLVEQEFPEADLPPGRLKVDRPAGTVHFEGFHQFGGGWCFSLEIPSVEAPVDLGLCHEGEVHGFTMGRLEHLDTSGEIVPLLYDDLLEHLLHGDELAGNCPVPPVPAGRVLLAEDFDDVPLGPNIDETVEGAEVVSLEPPEGWTESPCCTPEGWGITEWRGWSVADVLWWDATSRWPDREYFVRASGAALIADPDEWSSAPDEPDDGEWNASVSTPPISLDGVEADTLVVRFDTSWRWEDSQTAHLTVSYDGGPPVEVMCLVSEDPRLCFSSDSFHVVRTDLLNHTGNIPLRNPAGASEAVISFWITDAQADWWWAIDNLLVVAADAPLTTPEY